MYITKEGWIIRIIYGLFFIFCFILFSHIYTLSNAAPTLQVETTEVVTTVEARVETPVLRVTEHIEAATRSDSRRMIITSYNSEIAQTDSTPFITSTGERTRYGIIALSQELLDTYPYGSKAVILSTENTRGCGAWDVSETVFEVQDTMHPRKTNQIDIWLPKKEDSLTWGRCMGEVLFIQ